MILIPSVQAAKADITFIYYDDATSADSYKTFLEDNGFSVDLIHTVDIVDGMFSDYDIIIIGSDTGYLMNWEGSTAQVTAIDDSDLPIIGLGNGGFAFFGQGDGIDIGCGWDNGNPFFSTRTQITVVDSDHKIFNKPNHIPSGTIQIYNIGSLGAYCIYSESDQVALGVDPSSSTQYLLMLEEERYLFWGFDNSPDAMAIIGKYLFINIINYFTPEKDAGIPGYNFLFLLGIISIVTIMALKTKLSNIN